MVKAINLPKDKTDPDWLVFQSGITEGRTQGKKEILSFLEARYMHPSVDRGTPMAKAILELVRDIQKQFS